MQRHEVLAVDSRMLSRGPGRPRSGAGPAVGGGVCEASMPKGIAGGGSRPQAVKRWTNVRSSSADPQLLVQRQDPSVDQLGVGLDLGLVRLRRAFAAGGARRAPSSIADPLAVDPEDDPDSRLCSLVADPRRRSRRAGVQRSPSTRFSPRQRSSRAGLAWQLLPSQCEERREALGERGLASA